jgi:hypothetical protein
MVEIFACYPHISLCCKFYEHVFIFITLIMFTMPFNDWFIYFFFPYLCAKISNYYFNIAFWDFIIDFLDLFVKFFFLLIFFLFCRTMNIYNTYLPVPPS